MTRKFPGLITDAFYMDWLPSTRSFRCMERIKLVLVRGVIYYALFTLLLLRNSNRVGAVASEATTSRPEYDESDSSQHESSREQSPSEQWSDLSGRAGYSPSSLVSGWVFCTTCTNVDTPLFAVKVKLLCPHPPRGVGGGGRPEMATTISSTFTSKDGSFHLTANASYGHVMNHCVVFISKSSYSNCDMPPSPPSTPISLPGSVSSTSSARYLDGSREPHAAVHHYSLGSISFRSASCSSPHGTKATATTVGKPRTLLQDREVPLGLKQNHDLEADGHELERPVVDLGGHHDQHQQEELHPLSRSHHHHHHQQEQTMKQSAAAGAATSFPKTTSGEAMHAPRRTTTTSFLKHLMMLVPSHSNQPTTVDTTGHHRNNRGGGGGGPPATISTDRRRRHRGGPPRSSDYSHDSETNNTFKP